MRTPEEIKKGLECGRYGRWTVIADKGYNKSHHKLLLCRCDCGTERKNVEVRGLYAGRAEGGKI